MFWIRSGLQSMSISDWLTAGPAVAAEPSATLEDAREAMLDALGETGGRRRLTILLRIQKASDARDLWELRTDVMNAVAQAHGEWEGRRRLEHVTACFEGLLPVAALTSARGRHRMASARP
jgi:phage baseplate assembly protein W